MPKKHLCFWPNLRHQPKTAFSRLPPLHRANLEGRLRVDLTRSRSRRRMTAICAKRTTGIDAKHRTRPRPWMSQLGPEGEHFCTLFLRPVAIDSLKADSRCMRVLEWRVRAIHKRRWACRGSPSEFRTRHVARSLRLPWEGGVRHIPGGAGGGRRLAPSPLRRATSMKSRRPKLPRR